MNDTMKEVFDWSAFMAVIGTFFKFIPEVSGLVGLIWLCLRVWETETVKGWRNKDK